MNTLTLNKIYHPPFFIMFMYSLENGKCNVKFEPSEGFVTESDTVSLLHSETGKREFVVDTGNSGFIVANI